MTDPIRDVIQDDQIQGLTPVDRAHIKTMQARIIQTFVLDNARPEVAYLALLNCLGSLLPTAFDAADCQRLTDHAVAILPLYVEAYRTKEKTI